MKKKSIVISYFYLIIGSEIVDQILTVILGTSMIIGACTGFILDNTLPGMII